MKYAIQFQRDFKYLKDIDEIILYWSTKDDIVDYVKETYSQNQRIIISISDYFNIDEIIETSLRMREVHNNFSLRFDNVIEDEEIEKLKENKIRYYFNQRCNSWDILYGLSELGVSDVIITEELCFDLIKVSGFCKSRGIKIRVYPDIAQQNGFGLSKVIPDIVKFFIRPEDTIVYEDYVDVFEFWHYENISVIYEIYKQQQWLGDLKDIIIGITDEIPNTGFINHFAGMRLNCRKKCMQGNRCKMCKIMKNIAIEMNEEGLMIKSERQPLHDKEQLEELLSSNFDEDNEDE